MSERPRTCSRMGMNEACRYYGFTARALRFYEERGLLRASRDSLNQRYFEAEARDRLGWIAQLRRAGLPLPEIREVLESDDRARAALQHLRAHREVLNCQVAAVERAITVMADRSRRQDDSPSTCSRPPVR